MAEQNNPTENLEELAVGQSSSNNQWSEFPEGAPPEEKPQGPLSERIVSKQVKVKQSGYDELLSLIEKATSSEDEICKEYVGKFSVFLKESNPLLLEKAVQIIATWLEKADMKARKGEIEWEKIVSFAIDKGVGSGKPNIKKYSLDIVCLIFEAMDDAQLVIDIILTNMNNKLAKTSVAGLQTMLELLDSFGLQKLQFLKPFIPSIEKIQQMTNLGQRTESMNFYKEAFKWMGEPMKELMKQPLSKLKKAQLDELEKFFAEWDKGQVMKAKRVKEVVAPVAGPQIKGKQNQNTAAAAGGGLDVYEMADPVDIFTKQFNEGWTEKVLGLEKWVEKKDQMEEFIKTANNITKMQATANYQPIVQMCKKILMQEPNFNVIVAAIKIAGAMAKGLRKNYYGSAKLLFPLILDKFRDKKTIMIDETRNCLEKFFYAIQPEEIMNDIDKALQQKNADLKIHTISWLEKYFEVNKEISDSIEPLALQFLGKFKVMIEDGDAKVREKVFHVLITLKHMYSKQYAKIMSEVNPQKLAIIQKLEDKMMKGNDKGKKAGKVEKTKNVSKEEAKSSDSPKKASQQIKQQQISEEVKETKKSQPDKLKDLSIEQWDKSVIDMGTVEDLIREAGFPDKIINDLNSSNPQEKTKNLQAISNNEKEILSEVDKHLELFLLLLKVKTKEFKESTLVIQKEIVNLLLVISTRDSKPFNTKCFSIIVQFLLDKFGDNKYSEQVGNIISNLSKTIPAAFIVLSFLELADMKKGPKIFSDLSKYISEIYANSEGNNMPSLTLFNFAKNLISSSTNIIFKNSAILILKTMYKFHSKIIERDIKDLNPQLIKSLQTEFEKVEVVNEEQCEQKTEIVEEIKQVSQVKEKTKTKEKEEKKVVKEQQIEKEEKKVTKQQKEEKKENISKSKIIKKKETKATKQISEDNSEADQPDLKL